MQRRSTALSTRPAALLLGAAFALWPVLALAVPPNDTCATATVIASLPFSDSPDAAGANSGLPTPTCDSTTDPNGRFDVWYQFTPGSNLTFVMTETSTNDTFQAIYTGTCAGLTQVFCTDPESASFAMTGGTTYYIRVGYWFSTGSPTGTYNVNFDLPPPPPANDTCGTATVINPASLPYSNTVNAASASHDQPDATCNSSTDPNQRFCVWYSFTPSVTSNYILSETSANDTIRAVWTVGDPNTPCTTLTQLRCDDAETATFSMTAGTTYYISLAMWSSTTAPTGSYTLTLEAPPSPPANDTCATATLISSVPYSNTVDGRAASHDQPDVTCNSSTDPNQRFAVWYRFTPSCTASYTLAETSSNDTFRAVWTVDPNSPCTTLTQLRCDDAESVTFTMNAGQLYYISLGMWSSTTAPTGTYTLTLDGGTNPSVACNAASPSSLQAGQNTVLSATVTPACSPPSTGIGVNVDLTNIGGGTTNAMLDDGVPPDAAAGDNIFTLQVTVAPATTLGAKSLLTTVTDAQARSATCNMSVTVVPPPPANDECAGAIAIACGSSSTVDNTGATTGAGDPFFACRVGGDPNQGQGARSTWYTFVAASNSATIDTEGSAITDTMLHVLSGTCGSLTVIGCDDDGGTGLLSTITLNTLTPGNTYYIEAANYSPTTTPGNIKVNVSCVPPPPPPAHDVCSGAVAIACGSSNTTDNTYATTDANDPTFACALTPSPGARSLWYTFVPPGSTATIDTETSVVTDTLLHVFSGDCASGLTVIGCDDDSGTGLHSLINLTGLTPGTTYYIEAANYGAGTVPGNITVNVACGAVPCPGDADGDADVDQDDLDLTLFNFGTSGWPPNTNGDVDGDGDVDQDDLDLVLFYFGTSCP